MYIHKHLYIFSQFVVPIHVKSAVNVYFKLYTVEILDIDDLKITVHYKKSNCVCLRVCVLEYRNPALLL